MSFSEILLKGQQIEKTIQEQVALLSENKRDQKAYNLLEGVKIIDTELAIVTSGKKEYHVNYKTKTCTCPDHKFRGTVCKHIRAVLLKVKLLNELGK